MTLPLSGSYYLEEMYELRLLMERDSKSQISYLKLFPKVGSSCLPLKSQYSRGKVGRKESLLYSGSQKLAERTDSCPKADAALLISGQKLVKRSFRVV